MAFKRYIALLYTSNAALGTRCDAVALVAGDLEVAVNQVRLLLQAAEALKEEHGLERPRKVKDWRKSSTIQVNEFLRSLAKEMRSQLSRRWRCAGRSCVPSSSCGRS